MDCFDSDVLIYASATANDLGARVRRLFITSVAPTVGVGSTLLVPELLIKPAKLDLSTERAELERLLSRIGLHEVTEPIAQSAVELGSRYRLKAVDAVHLATAVAAGADRFITNNRRDFTKRIVEVDVTYPDELPAA